MQAIVELSGPNEHEIWRVISRLGLQSNVTVVPTGAGPEQLLTHCDALLLPERYGEMHSLILRCMGAGMAVVAAEDPIVDMLVN